MTRGCPEGMYPMDVDHDGETYDDFAKFCEAAEVSSDILNLPISWWFAEDDEIEDGAPVLTLVFLMPRKYGRTWAMMLGRHNDRAEVEAWLKEFTKREYATWFGWEDGR